MGSTFVKMQIRILPGGGEGSPSLALDTTGILTLTACMHDVTYDVTDLSGLSYM